MSDDKVELPVWVRKLFEPLIEVSITEPILDLSCLTFVVSVRNSLLVHLARQMILVMAGAQTSIVTEEEFLHAYSSLQKLLDENPAKLFVPSDLRSKVALDSIQQFAESVYETYYVDLFRVEKNELVGRVKPKATLESIKTEIGNLVQLKANGNSRIRILYYELPWIEHDVAIMVSQALGIGLAEIVLMTTDAIVMSPLSLKEISVIRSKINGICTLTVLEANKTVSGFHLLQTAKNIFSSTFGKVQPLKPTEIQGRIPTIVPKDRLITVIEQLIDRGPNRVLVDLLGQEQTVIWYGATDIGGNVAELIQVYVACLRSGLPGVFTIESRAHLLGDYWDRILSPSIELLRVDSNIPDAIRGARIDEVSAHTFFNTIGLGLSPALEQLSAQGMASFYRTVHSYIVDKLNKIFGVDVKINVIDSENFFQYAIDGLTVGEAIRYLKNNFSEDRVFANHSHPTTGSSLKIRLSQVPLKLYDQELNTYLAGKDVWPSGALVYFLMAALAHYGPVYLNLKDSRLGDVATMSSVVIPALGNGKNEAYYPISGVTRCYPHTRNIGGDNIDAVVLALLLEKHEHEMALLVRSMVERWVFPVKLSQAGLIQVFQVGLRGMWSYTRHHEPYNQNKRPSL